MRNVIYSAEEKWSLNDEIYCWTKAGVVEEGRSMSPLDAHPMGWVAEYKGTCSLRWVL